MRWRDRSPAPTPVRLAAGNFPEKTPVLLEPTVVLDEHSNYLNHLNQLRRINAGDDLTDRPGYGLYLVRIPVTLSPGPRSRRGKGAIITVSAKSLMTRDTLRNTLRNAVINETVNNLTQAICNQPGKDGEPASAPGGRSFSLVAYGDTEVFYGPTNIGLLRSEVEHQLARDLADEPHHRSARVAEWLRGELEASYHLLEEAAAPVRSGQRLAAARSARGDRRSGGSPRLREARRGSAHRPEGYPGAPGQRAQPDTRPPRILPRGDSGLKSFSGSPSGSRPRPSTAGSSRTWSIRTPTSGSRT